MFKHITWSYTFIVAAVGATVITDVNATYPITLAVCAAAMAIKEGRD